ncbi:glycosyltransferase family 2 protein [Frankia sp. CNm7]|uniref:Glycosyltransferase family 2 protein n=1 Tax=Frankia nepalensis TaxID=1836974 RepID=A0A937RHJ5_9ACTN|nr:glycosyltransferase family 2 protein [Frankia nepalensis]MBL7496856.1 glycosyltransferase family 2 protein [Frankia nepalensis]MBL7514680.1 glycosyltransferase family 2 protein [Frankia nepalensis]MBL7519436.1 glycosyltransferase family 2 protein [Frankia nepalensis]MBL7630485.1 glycosyltransferase family 2 protein [Frankia nepalensis]
MSVEPEIRVVVVTFRSGDVIANFLDTLAKATSRTYEVVVVDNSPELDAATASAAERPEVRLVRPGRNLGYGAAANRGAAGARGTWVVVANADISFTAGSVDELVDAAARWPDGGAFGPGIVNPDGALYPSARDLPSLGRGVGHALFGWFWPTNPWTASYRRERGAPREATAGWLSGSVQLLRREAFESVAGFDESYFMFMEDVDLDRRLGLAGWSSVYVPSAVVEHLGGHSTQRTSRKMLVAHHRSMVRYLCRQYAGPGYLPLRVALTVGLGARLLAALAFAKDSAGARTTRSAALLPPAGTRER